MVYMNTKKSSKKKNKDKTNCKYKCNRKNKKNILSIIKISFFKPLSISLLFFYWISISSCTREPLPSADPNPMQHPQYPSADIGLPNTPKPHSPPINSRQNTSVDISLPINSKRNTVVKQSYNKLGIPYKYGGSTVNGFDCSGLTQYVYRQAGIAIPRTTEQQLSTSQTIAYQQLRPGDLAFYKTGAKTRHVGIYIGNNQMIHASTGSKRVRTATITDTYWRQRFTKFGRFIQ